MHSPQSERPSWAWPRQELKGAPAERRADARRQGRSPDPTRDAEIGEKK